MLIRAWQWMVTGGRPSSVWLLEFQVLCPSYFRLLSLCLMHMLLCCDSAAHVYRAWMQDPSSLQVSFFPSGPLLHLVKLVGVVDVPSRGEKGHRMHAALMFRFPARESSRVIAFVHFPRISYPGS